jgi:hypothetical protein
VVLRSFGYPAVVALLLIGALPAGACVHHHTQTLANATRYSNHLANAGQRETRLLASVSGKTMRSPGEQDCLAYSYLVRRGSSKSPRFLCGSGKMMPLELTTSRGEHLSLPANSAFKLNLNQHVSSSLLDQRLLDRPCEDANGKDTFIEACLRPGDTVEVWACREPGTDLLAPCYDGVDEIESPPAGGSYRALQKRVRSQLAFSLLWACAWGLAALVILSRSAVSLARRRPSPTNEALP